MLYWEGRRVTVPSTALRRDTAPALRSSVFTLQLIADYVQSPPHFPSVGSEPLVFTLSVVLPVYLI